MRALKIEAGGNIYPGFMIAIAKNTKRYFALLNH